MHMIILTCHTHAHPCHLCLYCCGAFWLWYYLDDVCFIRPDYPNMCSLVRWTVCILKRLVTLLLLPAVILACLPMPTRAMIDAGQLNYPHAWYYQNLLVPFSLLMVAHLLLCPTLWPWRPSCTRSCLGVLHVSCCLPFQHQLIPSLGSFPLTVVVSLLWNFLCRLWETFLKMA